MSMSVCEAVCPLSVCTISTVFVHATSECYLCGGSVVVPAVLRDAL